MLILALEKLERESGLELEFLSGYRCKECNAAAGGFKNSAHLRGKAVDILVSDSSERWRVCRVSVGLGFRRIGIDRRFMHLDIDDSLPQDIMWLY